MSTDTVGTVAAGDIEPVDEFRARVRAWVPDNLPPEPAGAIEPRFRPTDETFVDPTTGHQMRVHADPRTGERRYVAER